MKARWKILIVLAVFLALFTGLSLVTMRIRPENEVEAYKELLREKGEKLEISEVLPPPVPAGSNAVSLVEAAFSMLVPGGSDYTYSNLPPAMRMAAPSSIG